jgi:hypothetical protein
MSEALSSRLAGAMLRSKVEVNWGSGPLTEPTSGWVDVTEDVTLFTTRRGRKSENDTVPPGMATIVFDDKDGSYDPTLNALGGPNAPDVIPGRRVRVRVSDVAGTIEALRPTFYFPLSLDASVTAQNTLVGTMEAGPLAFQRIVPSGPQPVEGQWIVSGGAFPTVLAFKPHVMDDRNGTRFEQGAYIRTDNSDAFGTSAGMAWVCTQDTDETFFMGQRESFRVGIDTAGKAVVDVWLDGQWERIESTTTIRDGLNWHMVAWTIVWDDTTSTVQVRLWVDGTFEAGGEGTGTVSTSTSDRVVVGHSEDDDTLLNADLWNGELCDAAWWSGCVFSDDQLKRLWEMSSAGLMMFNGHVLSWNVEPADTPIGRARVTAECADVGQALAQIQIDFDVRSLLLEMKPDRLYTFDNEDLSDLFGGPRLRAFAGVEFTNRERTESRRELPSVTTGVSDGALTFKAAPDVPASIRLPEIGRVPQAFAMWFRTQGTNQTNEVTLAYGFGTVVSTFFIWWLQISNTGRLQLFRQSIVGSTVTPSTWTGERIVTNDVWHHVLVSVGSGSTTVWLDGEQEVGASANQAWNVPLLQASGDTFYDLQLDELAIWYDTSPGDVTDFFGRLGRMVRAGSSRYDQELASDRIQTIRGLSAWSGSAEVSARADTRCGPLSAGTAWDLLQQTATTEGGVAFVDKNNRLVFRARQDRRRFGPVQVDPFPAAGVGDLAFTTDDRYLYNAVTVDGDVEVVDDASVTTYGKRSLSVAPRLPSSTFRRVRAEGLVGLYKDYQPRTDTLQWSLPSSFGMLGMLVELGDMLTVSRTVFPGTATTDYTQDCWVESVDVSVDAESKQATVSAQLSPVDPLQNDYFTFGVSTLETSGGDVLGW